MITKRFGPGQRLLHNIAFGTFNELKIVLDDGEVVNVEDFATDPVILNDLETRVAALENQVTNLVLPLIQNNLNLITAITTRLDLVEVEVAGKQNQLTATFPLSVANDDVHFAWLGNSYETRLDSLEASGGSTALQQMFVRVSALESMHI